MSSSRKILLGLLAGVVVGLFFGEKAAILDWAADGFVKLLQMTVLPYVVVSIIGSLGRLSIDEARNLGIHVGAVIAGLWAIALAYALLIPLAFPSVENASFFSSALVERRPAFDFVALYIPSNPFNSLANNVVPAVVLFSVLVGVALIGVERKAVVLDLCQVAGEAVARGTRFVAKLMPYGLFAIAATTAGTLEIEQLGRLQIYLVTYVAVALLVSLWVLPGVVAALTPIRRGELLKTTRDPLVTAFVAGDLFIVLPALVEASKQLIASHGIMQRDVRALPDVIIPASYNFPHCGKLLSISFVLFAGWFADAAVSIRDYPRLAFSGLVTFFGSLNAAVPFLLDLFRIPADTFQLFLATGVINSRFGTLLAAVHTVVVAVLGTCAMVGALTVNRRRVVHFAMTTTILTVAVLGGARLLFSSALVPEYQKDKVLAAMQLLQTRTPAIVRRETPAAEAIEAEVSTFDAIRRRGRLRVGYLPDALPYAFFNASGDLVGLDIELAHALASELGVELEFVPAPRAELVEFLNAGRCDLVMSGVAVTTERASTVLFSSSYLDETLGLLVPDHDRERFRSWSAIEALGGVTIGTPDLPYLINKLKRFVPAATLRPIKSADDVFGANRSDVDAVALPAERGSAWTLLHPEFSVVVPEGALVKVPLAYPIARNDQAFAAFINTWIDLKRKDGTLETLVKYWIYGQNAIPRQPRWSIARDVLHLMK